MLGFSARETQPVCLFFFLPPGGHASHSADEGSGETAVWLSVHWLRVNKKLNY